VIPITVPPLWKRPEDIPLLANHFLKKYAPAAGKSILRIGAASLEALRTYDWPGNVRQLENAIELAVALCGGEELMVELPQERSKARAAAAAAAPSMETPSTGAPAMGVPAMGTSAGFSLPAGGMDMEGYVAGLERSMLQSAMQQASGVQTRAAGLLGLSYRSFRHLMKKYDV
jgi:two-component system response regulator PilR (NtrC family)